MRILVPVASLFATVALGAAPAAGQIVYVHGQDLWVMNDNGSNQRPLLSASQVGGSISENSAGDDGLSVQPNGTGIAFNAAVPAAGTVSCDDENHCPGLYSLVNGKVTRLTQSAASCGTITSQCGGEDADPAVTATGNVVFYSFFVDTTFTGCGIYYCGYGGGLVQQYYQAPLDGSQTPTAWPLPAEINGNEDPYGFEPGFEGPIASDPADPTKIAYGGSYLSGGIQCNGGNCYPLNIENSSGAYNQVSVDDSFYYGLAFSQDGSEIADIETGDNKGIWVYPSNQNTVSNGQPETPSASFTWALSDPDNVSGAGQFDRVITGLTFVGNNEIVFSANGNLWSIPSSCWTPPAMGPPAKCTFPANATQLTHDGSPTTQNTQPAWTSSTTPITAYSSGNNANNGNNGNNGGPGDQITKIGLASGSVAAGRPLTIIVTLKSATKLHMEVLRYVPASGHGKHHRKAHYQALGQLVGSGSVGVNHLRLLKVHGHKLEPGKYELLISAGGKTYVLKFRVKA